MCTTFRVYFYCGHLKRTTYIEHSGIECTRNDSKGTVVDAKCPRCIARESQRDERLGAILDGNEPPSVVGEDRVYDAGDELSIIEQDALYGNIRAQAKGKMGEVEHRSCEDMGYDCDGCPWIDAVPERTRNSKAEGARVPDKTTTERSERQRLEEQDWRCFGTGCNCSRCVRVRGKQHASRIPQRTGDGVRPIVGGLGLDEGYRGCGKTDCKSALCEFEKTVVDERPGQ
jgi:hypothetical protein